MKKQVVWVDLKNRVYPAKIVLKKPKYAVKGIHTKHILNYHKGAKDFLVARKGTKLKALRHFKIG